MPNPMGAFESAYNVASKGRKPLQGVLDAFDEEQKLQRDMRLERVKRQPTSLDAAREKYYNAQAGFYEGGGEFQDTPDLEGGARMLGVPQEDVFMKPTITRFRGRTQVVPTPELKQALDTKSTAQINEFRSIHKNLNNNLRLMTPGIKGMMNPLDPLQRAKRGGIGSFALKVQSGFDPNARDFITFKAETDKLFQEFRKDTTGAQAALKELGWLSPDFPEPDDPPDTYINKAKEAMKRIEEGEQLLLDVYGQRGFRTGDLRKGSLNPLALSGRADTTPDASSTSNPRQLYNQLRSQGVSPDEARRQAGI